jgi:hypothetical protein
MLRLFEQYAFLFHSWRVVRYEQEGHTYMLHLSATLIDNSRLELRDYLFVDGRRTYAYQWMEVDNSLRRRWDNAPHWPTISTAPHHCHVPNSAVPEASVVTDLAQLMLFLQDWFSETE